MFRCDVFCCSCACGNSYSLPFFVVTVMYNIDPFKNEQFVRAPKKYMDINFAFAILYFVGVLVYAIWAMIYYANLPPVETNTMVQASTVPPITLQIATSCSSTWNCGDWSNSPWTLNSAITVTQVWDHVADDSPCKVRNGKVDDVAENGPATAQLSYELCSSSSNLDGIYLKIPFKTVPYGSGGDVYLSVLVTSAGADPQAGYAGMRNTQRMAIGELKSVYVSQTVYEDTINGKLSQEPFAADLFYDGHTSQPYAKLSFKSQQFARHVKIQNATSIMTMIGTIGGFAGILLTVLGVSRGFVVILFIRYFAPQKTEKMLSGGTCGKVGDACHECFNSCCNAA